MADHELRAFVLQNHPYLTMADMVLETGVGFDRVKRMCDKLEVVAITRGDQTRKFILENKDRMTAEKLSKSLGISIDYLEKICGDWGIYLEHDPVNKEKKSAGQILSEFQFMASGHYNHEADKPSIFNEL